jgi:hypothetical protein
MFACFSVLRTKIQTIPLIERYGHWHASGSTRNDWGTSRLWRENPSHPLCGWSLTQKLPKRTGKQKISAASLYIYFKINNVTSKTLLKLSNAGILPF